MKIYILILISLIFWSCTNQEQKNKILLPDGVFGRFEKADSASYLAFYYKNKNKFTNVVVSFGDGQYFTPTLKDSIFRHYYGSYGVNRAALFENDKKIIKYPFVIESKSWTKSIFINDNWVNNQEPSFNQGFYLSKNDIENLNGFDKSYYLISYLLAKKTGIDGDNFSLKTNINLFEKKESKSKYILRLDGLNEKIIIQLAQNIEKQKIFNQFSNFTVNSWDYKNDNFFTNLSYKRELELQIKNKNVILKLDKKIIFTCSYQEPIGEIASISISFTKNGKSDFIDLYNEKDEEKYHFVGTEKYD